jgi:hypothetical protein
VNLERRLNALEDRAGEEAEGEDHVLVIHWVDTAGVVHEEQRNYFRPAPVPGGTWGPLYKAEYYEAGKRVKVEHYERGEVTRVEEVAS